MTMIAKQIALTITQHIDSISFIIFDKYFQSFVMAVIRTNGYFKIITVREFK